MKVKGESRSKSKEIGEYNPWFDLPNFNLYILASKYSKELGI